MGCFVQLLEGDRNSVQWVYDSIRKDARHENVVVLTQGNFAKRLFPKWAMGVVNLDTGLAEGMLKEATHISEFMTLMGQGQCAGASADRVLKYFRQRLAGKPVDQARLARPA